MNIFRLMTASTVTALVSRLVSTMVHSE